MVVIGHDVVTDIVTLAETNFIEENDIDMNVMQDVIKENEIDMNVMQDDLNDTIGLKSKKDEITHRYVLCNKAGQPRKIVETNTLIEDGIVGTNAFKVFDFVENHNHPLIYVYNMDLSRAQRQLVFGEYMFIHRVSLSNIGPQKAHRLRVALLGGFDKVRGMPVEWNNFKRGMNKFIGEKGAQMLVDKMVKRQQHVLDDVDVDSDFRKDFHKLVWNVYVIPSRFQERWHALIHKYNLSENKWLSDMYEIRDRWVPGYFSKVPLCGLMKTTSLLESSNAFFQRYTQRMLDNENAEKNPVMLTKLPIKRHALVLVLLEALKSALYTKRTRERIMNDPDKLKVFLAKVTKIKKELENDIPSHNEPQNKDGLYEDLLGIKAPDTVIIMNLNKCGNKGHRRFKSAAEKGNAIKKERMNRKVPFKHRECSKCGQMFHNKHTCDEKRLPDEEYQALLKNKKDAGEVDVNESDKDEEDVKVDDVDEDDGRDEHDEDEDED
nr:FAR1 DNA binding domain-containing protein [Tanacetum cinerariifolium]